MASALFWIAPVHAGGFFQPVWSGFGAVQVGDPAGATGGIPFGQPRDAFAPGDPGVPGVPLYITGQGSGDAGLTIQDEPPFTLANLPPGYHPGWPGGRWDPAKVQGSAAVDIGDVHASFITTAGLVQSQTAQTAGKWYFEYTTTADLFSNRMGCGIGRLGVDLNFWTNSGRFNDTNPYGGVRVSGGFINDFATTIAANGGPDNPTPFSSRAGTTFGVAVLITDPDAVFRPAGFEPVSLMCAPCAPLVMGPGWPGRFG